MISVWLVAEGLIVILWVKKSPGNFFKILIFGIHNNINGEEDELGAEEHNPPLASSIQEKEIRMWGSSFRFNMADIGKMDFKIPFGWQFNC